MEKELTPVLIIGLSILLIDVILRLFLQRNELKFNKKKYDDEKEILKEHHRWLESEMLQLKGVAEPLAKHIKDELSKDVSWLVASLNQAKLGTGIKTLFNDRLGHFEKEKKFLALNFVPLLLNRCKQHISNNKNVCLLIDSGTTLFDFFETLAEEIVKLSSKENWMKNLFVATNNLAGVQVSMEKGRMNRTDRFSELAFKCHLFPGEPLSLYEAVTGQVTNDAITRLKSNLAYTFGLEVKEELKPSETIFIGITVGNWIRIRKTEPKCPIPMARGKGHLAFKQAMVENSDEIFVIAPLGKIFINANNKDINAALGLSENNLYPEKEIYNELSIEKEDVLVRKIKLVSTCRKGKNRLLFQHSKNLEHCLDFYDSNIGFDISKDKIEDIKHILFPFDDLPENPYYEKETELPHKITHKPGFMKTFFSIDG